ncbi:MAG: helix-turn-helix domain-containing protein [Candidatus Aminicenantes bacterium]|nr:MAG: helix-turn-helix domain-containing protein [Candidatus Aminicenantes bacterium]
MVEVLAAIFSSIRQLLCAIIIITVFWCQLWGLDPDKPVDQYLLDQWEKSAGIPSNTILSITQTPDGYLWICTLKELVRFDGMKFSIIDFTGDKAIDPAKSTIPDALFVDREGTLWIGSAMGLTSYRYQTGQFKTLTPADGITKDRIRRIKDDMNGNLWISFYSSYVNRFSNGEFTAFNASHGLKGKKINAVIEDRNGNLLFGSRENGVFIYREGKFFQYPIPGLDNVQIITMHEDRKGELWIGTNKGLFRVTEKGTKVYTVRDGLSNDYIICITGDSDRNLWVGTVKGLNRIKKKPDSTIGFESLLKHFIITCLFEDSEKSLWIGTYNSKIKRLKEGKFISYEPLKAHQDEIFFSLFENHRGDTWIGAHGGKLFRCQGRDFIELLEPPQLSGTNILSIAEDAQGNLWLGTNGKGVFQKKNSMFLRFTTREGLTDNLVTSISRDSRGNLWLSTFDGVSVIRHRDNSKSGKVIIESFSSRDGLLGKRVHNVYEDKERNIWIAADKGVTVLKDGKKAKKDMKHYLQGVSVTCIYEDLSVPDTGDTGGSGERVVWMATHGAGLKRLILPDGIIVSYSTANGMDTNYIYQFFEDQQENFWLMSDSGILRLSKKELHQFANGRLDMIHCTSFGISDGLKSLEFDNEFSRNSALKTRNGEFWFITKKGISIVNPARVLINKIPPPVVIEEVFFNERSIPLYQEMDAFKGITDFRFHFTAPTFLSPEKIKFQYRLEGFDSQWVFLPPGSERVAWYKNLEPGTYTFQVIACNSDGVWNRTGDAISFTLKPFFYQTLLFKILILIILAALAAAGFYVYKKQLFGKKAKYKSSSLTPQFADECIKRLTYLMEEEKVYRQADISLPLLAQKLSVPPHVLSQVLNEKLNRNVSDFINSYRIEEAKKILQTPAGARKKMVSIAFDVGFNTIVAFYNAFKKYTNMTPAQYKKEVKNKK